VADTLNQLVSHASTDWRLGLFYEEYEKAARKWQSWGGEEITQHLEKIEQSLERIAKALEKK
jgi:hypothetical protein